MLKVAALVGAQYVGQGSDGNPHNWDRVRRCDHSDYSPVCGACEGTGGLVWSDTPGDFTAPKCAPVPGDFKKASVPPKWGPQTTVQRSHEILIGPHRDPFCFAVFPENTSAGHNCYKPQTGTIRNGLGTEHKAIRLDYNQKGPWYTGGNVSSTIYHQGGDYKTAGDMWIVNKLFLGVTQCVCTSPTEGGAHGPGTKQVYPLQWNWTSNLVYVAREKIEVEYGVGEMELDHYAFGPHHSWSEPTTGNIVRLWQPYNGLQIFEVGKVDYEVDASVFPELPPSQCKKGTKDQAKLRIKCNDDGTPNLPNATEVSLKERLRAKTKVPRPQFRGDGHAAMSGVLNQILAEQTRTKPCDDWSTEDLRSFIAAMHTLRHPELDAIYNKTNDKRKIRDEDATLRWAQVDKALAEHPALAKVHRDGLCHEAVMLYVHHLTEDVREEMHANAVPVPLLSNAPHQKPGEPTDAHHVVHGLYEEHVTCQSCHSNAPVPSTPNQVLV